MIADQITTINGRSRVLFWTCAGFSAGLTAYLFALLQMLPNWTISKLLIVVAIVCFAGLAPLARKPALYGVVASTFVGLSVVIAFFGTLTAGGLSSFVTPFMIIAPITAGYFLTVRATIITGLAAILALIALYLLDGTAAVIPLQQSPEHLLTPTLLVLSTATIVAMSCVVGFSITSERMLAKARKAEAAKAIFLANMSHEIRTPMNGIIGLLDLLRARERAGKDRDYLDIASASAHSLIRILDDILDFSKLEQGSITIDPAPTDIRATGEEVINLFLPAAEANGVRLELTVDGDVPELVLIDPVRVRQVLWNLVGNALKFTPQGSVSVEMSHAPFEGREQLQIRVRDTGIGLSAEAQSRIFGRFSQADDSTTRHFGGTGLGLTICQEMIALMGGTLSVQSTEGSGSEFGFAIEAPRATPALAAGHAGQPAPQGSPRTTRRLRILVVDDQEINRTVAEALLGHLGQDVVSAESGECALDLLSGTAFDLVLLDIHMPGMDGFSTLRSIRAHGGINAGIPVMALTASAMTSERQQYLDAGMVGCLSKPIDLIKLEAALASLAPPTARSAAG